MLSRAKLTNRRLEVREVTVTMHIPESPEAVFAVIADPHKWFLTSNRLATVMVASAQLVGVGTAYCWTFKLPLGRALQFDEVVTEWVENERFAYRATSGWDMNAINALTRVDDGTQVTFTLRYRLPGIWQWLIPRWLVRVGIRRALANLRRQVTVQTTGGGSSEQV